MWPETKQWPINRNERNCMNYRMFTLTCKMWNNETVIQNVRERIFVFMLSTSLEKRSTGQSQLKQGIVRMEKNVQISCISAGLIQGIQYSEQSISAWQKGNKVHMRHGTAFYVPFWWYVYWERLHDTRFSFCRQYITSVKN